MKKVLCVTLVLSILFCFGACGSSGSGSVSPNPPAVKQNVTGRYELTQIEYANGTVSSGETLQSAETIMGDMYVELFSDGTAQLALLGQIHDMEFSGDKMWQSNAPLHTYVFSVGNGKVTLQRDGDTYTFMKK